MTLRRPQARQAWIGSSRRGVVGYVLGGLDQVGPGRLGAVGQSRRGQVCLGSAGTVRSEMECSVKARRGLAGRVGLAPARRVSDGSGSAWQAWLGQSLNGASMRVPAGQGQAGRASHGSFSPGSSGSGTAGMAGLYSASQGSAGSGSLGSVWLGSLGGSWKGSAGLGLTRQACLGAARRGQVRQAGNGQERHGQAWQGLVRQARLGTASLVPSRWVMAGRGMARLASAGWVGHGVLVPAVARLGAAWSGRRGLAGLGKGR